MTTHAEAAFVLFQAAIGEDQGTGEWFIVDQERIDAFAEATEDRQFIHVDPVKSAEHSPYGGTIAHGFLTLSLITHLCSSIRTPSDRLHGLAMGLNYGFDRIRFITPVRVGSRLRASSVLSRVELRDPHNLQVTQTVTLAIDGEVKPALVAEWTTRFVYS